MQTPSWLYYFFGVLMLLVAAYSAVLLVVSLASHRRLGLDVDIAHLAMGVAMAGMFVQPWAFGRSMVWELVFASLFIWFLVESTLSIQRHGLHVPHASIHMVMSFAMLLMYWFPPGSPSTGEMAMDSTSGPHIDPGLSLVLVMVLLSSAIFTLANPVKGVSHHGSLARREAAEGNSSATRGDTEILRLEDVVMLPLLEDLSHVVMCVAMALMLVLML